MCFPDTSLFPASPPRAEMKPWPLLTSIAGAQSGSGEEGIVSLAARDRLGHWWSRCHRRVARGSILLTVSACGTYRLQIGVNFSGIAAAPFLSPSCKPSRGRLGAGIVSLSSACL